MKIHAYIYQQKEVENGATDTTQKLQILTD